ncbi:MAG: bifunctional diaminohydroxyphosphoribosylaminopyrimidine deaminase/5-amino-6-(5-phosphoribosylamino)uracil reductase RibD [Chitinophagales bacterium]|nr:bifunctional diaminohydroxyphosphoribosylaminopyrimidine deaminase/5-amino-6-(5-phosphoribosylamino)uracil reductase RibD [Chitinophagales bacterium]MDW8272632.1 bifunctional diaminohydroxyphosphoribosylaminopyrimidine deaminase/5-amino-6-(5-phosphoribosylamino)uracil reductase RibD [Chitinophagales bacterium]
MSNTTQEELSVHQPFMRRCLQLASLGLGKVAPNPLVGAVLVHNGRIIAEGFHKYFGGNHAEVECVLSVPSSLRTLIPQSTLYVNLEPCSHYGKTPPCSNFIVQHQIKQVVVGHTDPNPIVSGKGLEYLLQNGVQVTSNTLKDECEYLNRRFITYHLKKRPFVIVKVAQSADGFMAPYHKQKYWLTNRFAVRLSHRWRAEEQAILVGKNTALADNPRLTTRIWNGKNPLRILIDKLNEVPLHFHIFNNEAKTLVFNSSKEGVEGHIEWIKADFGNKLPQQILAALYLRNIQSLIIEGGAATIQSFIDEELVDEARLIITSSYLEKGLRAPTISGLLKSSYFLVDNLVKIYQLR